MLGEFAADGVPGPDACGEGVCDGRLGKLQRDHKLQFRKGSKKRFLLENFPKLVPPPLRHKKSELSGWQLSTRKNFPDEVRKSFLRPKSAYIVFRDKKIHEIAI